MSKGLVLSSRKPVQLVYVAAILLLRPPRCGPLTVLDHTVIVPPQEAKVWRVAGNTGKEKKGDFFTCTQAICLIPRR